MKKILFLDIDGVLNSISSGTIWNTFTPEKYGLCNKCLRQVKRILTKTKSEIVWITSWRNHSENFVWELEYKGKEYSFKTPFPKVKEYFKDFKQDICDHLIKRDKASDIRYYLGKNNFDETNCKFAILDDDTTQGFDREFPDHYFRSLPYTGVDKNLADSVIKYLS